MNPLDLLAEGKPLIGLLLDSKRSPADRGKMLALQLTSEGINRDEAAQMLTGLFQETDRLKKDSSAEAQQLIRRYEQLLMELVEGPVRLAIFVGQCPVKLPGSKPRLHVILPDGTERHPTLHDEVDPKLLRPGDTVFVDPKAAVILACGGPVRQVGVECTFNRRLGDSNEIEIKLRDETLVVHAAQEILDAIVEGTLRRDDRVLTCPTRRFAFHVVPAEADKTHRFVDTQRLPQIDLALDVGNPHWCLTWLMRRMRLLMFRPDLLARFDLRLRVSLLMIGGPGTGKTFTLKVFLTVFYSLILERTGRADIGSRVIRVKMGDLLSEWLGVSDKNIDRLFDDIATVGRETVRTASGEEIRLPCIVILEEADGVGASREGTRDGAGGAYNRIMSTLLQRFDDPIDDLSCLPICFVSTTNKPGNLDAAMFRRLGGTVAHFKRLDREGFASVLSKKVKPTYPIASRNGTPQLELRQRLIDQVVASLYAPGADHTAKLELTLSDGVKLTKHARDFATPALIELGVASAIDDLAFAAEQGDAGAVGLSAALLLDALHRQIDSVADTVNRYNADDYLDLPEHAVVAQVRRLRQPLPPYAALLDDSH